MHEFVCRPGSLAPVPSKVDREFPVTASAAGMHQGNSEYECADAFVPFE